MAVSNISEGRHLRGGEMIGLLCLVLAVRPRHSSRRCGL